MIGTVTSWWKALDRGDRYTLITTGVLLLVWWSYIGRRKYSTKGMTKNG